MKSTPVVKEGVLFINGYGSPANEPGAEFQVETFSDTLAQQDAAKDGVLSVTEMPDETSQDFFPTVDLDNNGTLQESEWDYYRASQWLPTQVGFKLSERERFCTVSFFHSNWAASSEHFAHSNYCWAQLLKGLKDFVEHGKVIPFDRRN